MSTTSRSEWTKDEIETLALSAYRKEGTRCPICSGPVRASVDGACGRKTSFVMLYCERCRTSGEYDPDYLESMDLSWSREEMIQIQERYWARRIARCPRDQAVLHAIQDQVLGRDATNVHFNCPLCGRAFWTSEIAQLQDPDSFEAQYEVLRLLGQGGMGRVDLVRRRKTGRELAAKRIRPEFLRSEEAVRRFQREERILQRLSHPHIVPIEGSFLDEDGAVLLMPFMPGGTLTQAITSPRVSFDVLARHFEELAQGLAFLHEQGVVHRDLKPDNVLIDAEGHARISDFGLARLVDRDTTTLTMRGDFLGTWYYAAPEQRQSTAEVDRRCDIYALGLIAYEIARRESPYGPPISSDDFCSDFRQALKCCLSQRPEARTLSALDVARALRQQLSSLAAI